METSIFSWYVFSKNYWLRRGRKKQGQKGGSCLRSPNFRDGNEKPLVKKSMIGKCESEVEGAFNTTLDYVYGD